jgi:hypothetical protein
MVNWCSVPSLTHRGTDPRDLLTVIVVRTSRPHPHLVNSGSSIVAAIHLSMLLASLASPANPSLHGESFQLGFRVILSSMRALSALIFCVFYADFLAVALLGFMCDALLAHTLPLAFFDHRFALTPPSSLCISHVRAPYLCPHFTPSLPCRASPRHFLRCVSAHAC